MNNQDSARWTERELIERVYHELNQSITVARGLVQVLQSDSLGSMNTRQRELLTDLQRHVGNIDEANRWLRGWLRAHAEEE